MDLNTWSLQVLAFLEPRPWLLNAVLFLVSWVTMICTGKTLILWLKGLKGVKRSPRE